MMRAEFSHIFDEGYVAYSEAGGKNLFLGYISFKYSLIVSFLII